MTLALSVYAVVAVLFAVLMLRLNRDLPPIGIFLTVFLAIAWPLWTAAGVILAVCVLLGSCFDVSP